MGGVFWPRAFAPIDPGDPAARARAFERLDALAAVPDDSSAAAEMVELAAALGDFDTAVETARRLDPARAAHSSLKAAALLARNARSGRAADLLDAAEIVAAERGDVAARCNSPLVLRHLGLGYRAAARLEDCPCAELVRDAMPPAPFPLDGRRHSADRLDPDELRRLEAQLARDPGKAAAAIREGGQAWRAWLEGEALAPWLDAPDQADRGAVARRTSRLARAYADATGNPAPLRLWTEIAAVSDDDVPTVREALARWREAVTALSAYEPERVEGELGTARGTLASAVPSLLPAVDLALATARYYLGDDAGMLARAQAVRQRTSLSAAPWAWARAHWLEAAALQGRADWSAAIRSAEEAGRLYEAIGEPANAGFQDQIVALSLESSGVPDAAEEAYLRSAQRLASAGDTRLLGGALALFARQQSRAGRRHLAVELQRETVLLDTADATPQVVAEAEAVLAEQLYRAGAVDEGDRAVERSRAAAARIESPLPRRRAEAILAHARASHLTRTDPAAAERALDQFLADFDSFGERFFRAEALTLRARARLMRRNVAGAEEDLAEALTEIASQSRRLEERTAAVALMDQAREALEMLVGVLVAQPGGEVRALAWIEALRREQIGRGFGVRFVDPRHRGEFRAAPEGACVTAYWSSSHELLSWTSCSGGAPRLARVAVDHEELGRELAGLRAAAQRGELTAIRRHSATVSRWLVSPLGKLLSGAVSWTVVPDASFPAVPFAWLTLDERFVFEARMAKVAPTWPEQPAGEAAADRQWRALAIGDPTPPPDSPAARLPHARAEAEQLAALFPGSTSHVGAAATWTNVLAARGAFDLLHLATHTSSGSVVPLSARLHLAPEAERPDGRVSADEIAHARFPDLALAVLASCGSATTDHRGIGGGLDFAHAFLGAGAHRVVGSLWDVPDGDVSTVVRELYAELRQGAAPEQALRRVWLNGLDGPAEGRRLHVRTALQMSSAEP